MHNSCNPPTNKITHTVEAQPPTDEPESMILRITITSAPIIETKNIKKPQGAKPGFVIYKTNYTAFVTPSNKVEEIKNG